MNIQFFMPLANAIDKMKNMLFKPFNFSLWLAVGLSAFLADLMDGYGSRAWLKDHHDRRDFRDIFNLPYRAWEWITDNPGWTLLILFGVLMIIALVILLTWLSSRGKMMFVHQVATGTGEIVKPWHEYRKEGNSLTLWRLVFSVIIFAVLGALIFQFVIGSGLAREMDIFDSLGWMTIIGFGLLFLAVILFIAGISALLNDFVIPIMYVKRLSTNEAWRIFLPMFRQHLGHFILYLLLICVLHIAVFIAVFILAVFTCCVGVLLLLIPYVNAVVLLPVSISFRAFSLSFLAQFGPEFDLFQNPVKVR